jgi:micrococcal nuclease
MVYNEFVKFYRFSLIFGFILLTAAFGAPPPDSPPDIAVYVTRTGSKYHTENCSALQRSKIALSLSEAAAYYEPCSICNPPVPAAGISASAAGELYRVNAAGITASAKADVRRMVRAEVIEHVDGDTLRLRVFNPPAGLRPVETVRLLGVDTPETVHPNKPVERFGREASAFTQSRLSGKTVYAAFDWDLRDRYGRLLAYIYTAPGECFNAEIIRQGYGYAYLRFPFQFQDEFKDIERRARQAGRGLWGAPAGTKGVEKEP